MTDGPGRNARRLPRALCLCAFVPLCLLAPFVMAAEPPAAPAFAARPAVVKDGDKFRISFAASRETDVAVYIEEAGGGIVRHLAAGLLGKNPPEPLKAGTLAQSVEWDGLDDDGRDVLASGGAGFRARVALGLKAGYGGLAFTDSPGPARITSVLGLATGPDGRLYVLDDRSAILFWPGTALHVLRRDGSYERTLKPFPPNLSPERLKDAGAFRDAEGRLVPLIHRPLGMTFYPCEDEPRQQMAVTPEGHLLLAVRPERLGKRDWCTKEPRLAAIDSDGGIPDETYAGPALFPAKHLFASPRLAVSGDGRYVYLAGVGAAETVKGQGDYPRNAHAVYRVKLPERGPAEVFFGDPETPGGDETHLNVPRNVQADYRQPSPELGLAIDGRGHLLTSDPGNNRVVVLNEKDGSFAGSFPVPDPGWLGVAPRTGAVYVRSGSDIVKFSGWKDAREVCRAPLPAARPRYSHLKSAVSLALDASTEPAVIWLGRESSSADPCVLSRCEDRGDRFGGFEPAVNADAPMPWGLSADPMSQEVCCLRGTVKVSILNEASGKVREVRPKYLKGLAPSQGPGSATFHLGRGGRMYSVAFDVPVCQFDSTTGQGIPFPAPAAQAAGGGLPGTKRTFGPGRACHGLGVDHRGNIYAINPSGKGSGLKVSVFSPEGEPLRTVVHSVLSRGMLGPRVDAAGNIYIAEAIYPSGRLFPEDLDPRVPAGTQPWYAWLYGSVIKFGPAGGGIWPPAWKGGKPQPASLPPDLELDPALKKEHVDVLGHPGGLLVGARWWRFGYSPLEDRWNGGDETCHCTYTDFDADDFGRVFHPDQGRFRAVVLDTNGNEILHFGSYGNQDCCGPESYVPDPREKFFRPRRPDDPGDLKSPFAEPEIAFGWITGLAVTDRYAYVADALNRRVLRVKLDYAADETVAFP